MSAPPGHRHGAEGARDDAGRAPGLPADLVTLISNLEGVDSRHGIRFVDRSWRESWVPYPDLAERIHGFARRFHERGVLAGSRVLVALSPEEDVIAAFLALSYLGAVPFSVPPPHLGQDPEVHRGRLRDLVTRHGVGHVLATSEMTGLGGADLTPLDVEPPSPRESGRPVEPAHVEPSDVAFVQFSSGSTSDPKGVRITHRNLMHNLSLSLANDRRTPDDVMVSWLPLFHDMGLVGGLFSNLALPNDLVLMPTLGFMMRPAGWLELISRHRGSLAAVPNFALDLCCSRVNDATLRERSIDLGTFRYVYNGSEPVRVGSIRRFEDKFGAYGFGAGRIYPVYGMAEATLIVSAPSFGHSLVVRRAAEMDVPSVGYPLGDFEVRIRDDRGGELPAGSIGEIWLRGASVTPGYLSDEGGIDDGWLGTGDLGLLDEQGRLYVTGRKKDLIIHQGRNFYGHEIAARIEQLAEAPRGKVAVFSVDQDEQERVVVMSGPPRSAARARPSGPSPPARPRDGASSQDAQDGLPRYKEAVRKLVLKEFGLPVHAVQVVRKIPKTTSGKVARQVCRRLYLEAEGRDLL